ncbi:DUF3987 domain-containing protein [Winogradskyella sp.]|uniref:DUF3987 domain-containing protein n=1 Tax=Winogradskyella sp. TaxID=1883156 RepID=UPI0025CE4C75|nr:DUF3987 domain-containing protein [Winogradskyella sp.]
MIQNATVEAATYTHLHNKYSIGIYVDELSYLIEKMANKNNSEGNVWRVFLLQGNTNKHIDVNRKTTESYRLEQSYPTLLGSLQTQKIPKLFGNGNLESGFVDRILFTNKLEGNEKISKALMPDSTVNNYSHSLNNLILYRKSIEEQETSLLVEITDDAENILYEYSQQLLLRQKAAYDNTKEYISKMMISIHKLTLMMHLIQTSHNSSFQNPIVPNTVQLAIYINEFYFTNFKIILAYQDQGIDRNLLLRKIIEMAKINSITQKTIEQLTGRSKAHISKIWNNKY